MKNAMKRLLMVGMTFGTVLTASAARDDGLIYRNDFSVRESAGAIPRVGETYDANPYPTTAKELYSFVDKATIQKYMAIGRAVGGEDGFANLAPMYENDVDNIDSRPCYDGWFQPYFSKGSKVDHFYHQHAGIQLDGGDPCFRFWYASTGSRTGLALHSLNNAFTNGQLKIQVDLKFPVVFSPNQCQFWAFPVYDKYMDIEAWNGSVAALDACSPGLFGVRNTTSTSKTADKNRLYPLYYDARKDVGTVTQLGNNYLSDTDKDSHYFWFRYEVTYDLDTAKFSGSRKSIGDVMAKANWKDPDKYAAVPHPTFETTPKADNQMSFSDADWINCTDATDVAALLKENGGISGVGFYIGQMNVAMPSGADCDGENVTTNKVLADNIRVSWKAPGTSEFVVAYEDDFSHRSYRILSPKSSSCIGTYSASTEVKEKAVDTFTTYVKTYDEKENFGMNKCSLLPSSVAPFDTSVQPIGSDGWRRLCPFPGHMSGDPWTCNKCDEGKGGNMVEVGRNNHYVCFAQLIGRKITSGKVKLSVDAFVPAADETQIYLGELTNRVAVALGSEALYSSATVDIPARVLASGGVLEMMENGEKKDIPFVETSSGLVRDPATVVPAGKWYRLTCEADLDVRTYDVSVTPLGDVSVAADFVPTEAPIKELAGLPFSGSATDIGAFYLWGYGYDGTMLTSGGKHTRFDNIRIWQNGELVYDNDFDTRTRYLEGVTRPAGRLAYQYDRDDGPDHWIRKSVSGAGAFEAEATVREVADKSFLSLGRQSGDGYKCTYVTSIGETVGSGRLKVSVDVRPPRYWYTKMGSRMITLALGNKRFEQNGARDYAVGRLLIFGFRDWSGVHNGYRYEDIVPVAYCSPDGQSVGTGTGECMRLGESLDGSADKWYRFVAKIDLDRKTYRVSVYELGSDFPSPRSAHGKCVGQSEEMALMNPIEEGVSSLEVSAVGIGSTFGEVGFDPLQAQIDNIEICQGQGMVLVVR